MEHHSQIAVAFHATRSTHVRFWRRDAELDEPDLGLLDSAETSPGGSLVQHQSVDQLRVLHGAAENNQGAVETSSSLEFHALHSCADL